MLIMHVHRAARMGIAKCQTACTSHRAHVDTHMPNDTRHAHRRARTPASRPRQEPPRQRPLAPPRSPPTASAAHPRHRARPMTPRGGTTPARQCGAPRARAHYITSHHITPHHIITYRPTHARTALGGARSNTACAAANPSADESRNSNTCGRIQVCICPMRAAHTENTYPQTGAPPPRAAAADAARPR